MNDSTISLAAPMPPLPGALAEDVFALRPGLLKRERTRLQLMQAGIRVFSARGYAGATIQEIAALAGMTSGTVYNHFKTKEEVARAVAVMLAETLCRRIADTQHGVSDGAQRMAIGNQRYIWLAHQSPAWALLMLDVSAVAPELLMAIRDYTLADLRLGVRQKRFRVPSEVAAMDLINGTVAQAMRSVALGMAPASHGQDVAACVLCGLGMSPTDAAEVAKRPLPPIGPLADKAGASLPRGRARPVAA
jgi:AcrR family transcriptional regulator